MGLIRTSGKRNTPAQVSRSQTSGNSQSAPSNSQRPQIVRFHSKRSLNWGSCRPQQICVTSQPRKQDRFPISVGRKTYDGLLIDQVKKSRGRHTRTSKYGMDNKHLEHYPPFFHRRRKVARPEPRRRAWCGVRLLRPTPYCSPFSNDRPAPENRRLGPTPRGQCQPSAS